MKKILSVILCVVMLATLALMANADAINMADGLKTDVTVKKANPAAVVKDGIIGAGEYVEVDVNRDPDTSDLLLSWWDSVEQGSLIDQAMQFLPSVHFYYSWDEVHGLNIAAKATLLEDPVNLSTQADFAAGAGDEFLFQFGMMASVVEGDFVGDDILYRGISINTETGEPLIGDYGVHGYNDAATNFVFGEDYFVRVNGREVTYEISYPIEAVVVEADRNGNIPNDGAMILMNTSVTGGSTGTGIDQCKTYIVSLGDGGYCMSKWAGTELSHAKTYFSHEEIPYTSAPVPTETTQPTVTTEPQTEIVTSIVTEEVVVTTIDDDGNVIEVTDADGNKVTEIIEQVVSEVVTVTPTTTTPGANTQAPTTGDPMIIAAVVAAISACGIVVAKKRK